MSHQLINQLQEKRANVWEQAKALLDAASADKRDLTAEEDQSWQRMNADIDMRHALAVKFAAFEAEHITGVKPVNKDPETYIEKHG